MVGSHGMCQRDLHLSGALIASVFPIELHRCNGIPVDGQKLTLLGTAIPDKQDQYITLSRVLRIPLGYGACRIDTGEEVGLQISLWRIGLSLVYDVLRPGLCLFMLKQLFVCSAKDSGDYADPHCQHHCCQPKLLI